ncbi:hypothetical protein PPERSA_09338 [Pseudocohnilembus persalinus]|uniref:Anoctamin transmembrane domain-containing protein n=1 Tax=Pseudocohnilembus persalinus TaxID=266149 RepID=A0A0V0QY49_PSEPJ|nr:hypothetical protein PPERSA_09338 [Pseudocohnilembus persalinus]|eukprot:KRX07124.1 hypothetical protein PPERSA_09338 [Pseudocohnilembus persalinus]
MLPIFEYSLQDKEKFQPFQPQINKNIKKVLQNNNNNKKEIKSISKREDEILELMQNFRNNIIEKNPKIIKRNATKQDQLEGFLSGAEFEELQQYYNDYNIADLVIEFPNPDQQGLLKNEPIKFEEAEKIFDNMLTVIGRDGQSKEDIKKEREAFLYSFLLLKDFDEEKVKAEINKKTKLSNKNLIKLSDYDRYLQNVIYLQKQEEQEQRYMQRQFQNFLDINQKQQETNQLIRDNLIHSLLSIKLSEVKQFQNVRKCLSGGEFLVKRQVNSQDFEWICKNNRPRDFSSLVRNTIMIKLNKNAKLHTRMFLSGTGDSVFMLVKSSESVVKQEAEISGLTKQVELGVSDLFSLEPCDQLFRPFRLKNLVRQSVQQIQDKIKRGLNFENLSGKNTIIDFDIDNKANADQLMRKGQDIFNQIQGLNENDLFINIAKKQIQMDDQFQEISESLNHQNVSNNNNTQIINDYEKTSIQEWKAYLMYQFYIVYFSERIKKLILNARQDNLDKEKRNNLTNIVEMNKGFLYKLAFRKSLSITNQIFQLQKKTFLNKNKQILKNLWNRVGLQEPIPPSTDFFQTQNEDELGGSIWRQYEINNQGHRSQFLNMEKIKLTNSIILKQINMSKLLQNFYIRSYFPIHDEYQLKGKPNENYFQPLQDQEIILAEKETPSEKQLRYVFNVFRDYAESSDFTFRSLEEETQYNKLKPWHISDQSIRDYFGEKIAIYFRFLSFYTFHLSYMSIIAIIIQIVHSQGSEYIQDFFNVTFSITVIIWSTLFIEFWKREQVIFSIKYGQQDFEEDETERPSFKGSYQRNIMNDELNDIYYPPIKRNQKIIFSFLVSLTLIGLVVYIVVLIFIFKAYLLSIQSQTPILQTTLINPNIIPSVMNAGQIAIFNIIYDKLANILNNLENHKLLSSYENSLIAKIFLFKFFNLFNSCIFIAYLSPMFEELKLCEYSSGKENCFYQLSYQIGVFFIVNFAKNISELAVPFLKNKLQRKIRQMKSDEKPVNHPFLEMDTYVEIQSTLTPYLINEEVDGTLEDYMELAIQFSFLALFGLAFPSSFIMAFISNIFEIQVDKLKFVAFTRRPLPQGACNIGTWLLILDLISFSAIFSNSGLIAYTSQPIVKGNFRLIDMGDDYVHNERDEKVVIFCTLLIVFLAIKYLFRYLIPDSPEIADLINKRHQNAIDRVVKGFVKKQNNNYEISQVNFSMGGLYSDSQKNTNNQEQNDNKNSENLKQEK